MTRIAVVANAMRERANVGAFGVRVGCGGGVGFARLAACWERPLQAGASHSDPAHTAAGMPKAEVHRAEAIGWLRSVTSDCIVAVLDGLMRCPTVRAARVALSRVPLTRPASLPSIRLARRLKLSDGGLHNDPSTELTTRPTCRLAGSVRIGKRSA